MVGDENQSIYGFRAAYPEALEYGKIPAETQKSVKAIQTH
ncbi:MAG: UvrD-helicase domain-containing protein [Eubacterium sp.]